jgi:hypothetical protein
MEELRLRRGELLIAQHACRMQLRQLLQLHREVGPGGLWRRRRSGRRRSLLLLHLLKLLLLIRLLLRHLLHVRLLVGGGLLPGVLLLLVVGHGARCPGDDRRCGGDPDQTPSSHSSHHVLLLSFACFQPVCDPMSLAFLLARGL